ncbi:OmpA family protein [Flavobacteriaceae bacterium]|nr:OmpA family protein [Flavobacteriaceae bacterium]MDA9669950.1 OmpA family protein [Flavobacteriaceae bacterium]
MKLVRQLLLSSFFFICLTINAQTSESPWAIAVGVDLINLQGDNVESGLNFGAPALSLSRYISSGLSVGIQYGLGSASPQDNVDLDYSFLDGVVKFNLSEENIVPYLFAGYGLSRFADGVEKEGAFPSGETGRTTFGGIGVNIPIGDQFNVNVSTSYRGTAEIPDSYNHLQHIIGLSYNFGAGDADGDGVPDKKDECPDIPGLKEFNGCPDTDGDGIPDTKDRCPEEAGSEELNGCPDSDGDGVVDIDDACPNKSGNAEMNGCPDSDGDGVADNIDRCPEAEGDEANGGCPWADADGDGIPDKDDSCPDIAGTSENSGCPAEPTDLISFISNSDNRILFRANSSKLDSGDKETLDKLIVLLGQFESASIVIEGHASSDGSESYNQKLSEKRASSVETYLLDKGITNERLSTIGYGESKPIGNNNTVKGRANSRRVNINRSANIKVN